MTSGLATLVLIVVARDGMPAAGMATVPPTSLEPVSGSCLTNIEPPQLKDIPTQALQLLTQNASVWLAPATGWEMYRLGDLVLVPNLRQGCRRARALPWCIADQKFHCKSHNESLACQYLQRVPALGNNFSVLSGLVRSRLDGGWRGWRQGQKDTVVVHLRLGDKLVQNQKKRSKETVLSATGKMVSALFPIVDKDWWKVQACAKSQGLKRVLLVAAAYVNRVPGRDHGVEKVAGIESARFLLQMTKMLQNAGLKVSWSLGGCPDDAFVLLASAPFLMTSVGAFSSLAGRLVSLRVPSSMPCFVHFLHLFNSQLSHAQTSHMMSYADAFVV